MNEQESIRACKRGELEHFEDLYSAYVHDIYRFVYYRVRNKEIAEDVTSDIFFKALRAITSFSEGQSFRAWIYTIARNTLVDHYRKHKDVQTLDADDAPDVVDEGEDIEERQHNILLLEQVKESLKKLSDTQQEIVTMRVWDELSYKEIAEITGKTEGNCKMIFSRAVGQLREMVPISVLIVLMVHSI
jgi:RNA polymerase sigma-70 factor (ECF subfamily)